MRGVTFNWKNNNNKSMGVIAQEVEKIIPELVHTDDDGSKTVTYSGIIGLLIEAIKEQQQTISGLEEKLNNLGDKK